MVNENKRVLISITRKAHDALKREVKAREDNGEAVTITSLAEWLGR